MKKIIAAFLILLSFNSYAQPGIYSGTFLLDLSLYSGNISNVEFVRGTQSDTMTSIGNNQYSYNFSSFLTTPTIYYKFSINGVVESFSSIDSCLFNNSITNDTSRVINLGNTTPSIVCWESCTPCIASISGCTDSTALNYDPSANLNNDSCEYNVTFYVDMNEANQVFDTVEVNGTFNSWCGNCAQMNDVNNDNIWEITIPLLTGSYEYKFSADNWSIEENLYESDDCVVGSAPYINMSLVVLGNQVLDTVCWNRCYSCDTERNFYNVTFQVDMSNVAGSFVLPEVNGTFNSWCGNCWTLESQGNNIFSNSFNVDTSLHTFKFSADNWGLQEELDSNLSCILINYDPSSPNGWGYVNRYLSSTKDTILAPVCWEDCFTCTPVSWECDGQGNCFDPGDGSGLFSDSLSCVLDCQVTNILDNMDDNFIIYPNPTKGLFSIKATNNIEMIIVYNKLGQEIFRNYNLEEITEINFLDKTPDFYFIELYDDKKIIRKKIIKI